LKISSGGAARFRRIETLFEIDQAAAAQERGEVADLAMDLKRLIVELRQELADGHALDVGDLLDDQPEMRTERVS
jgi:hypothetical protein